MASHLGKLRDKARILQSNFCWWCEGLMSHPVRPTKKGVRPKSHTCTAEHLIPRGDGGPDRAWNVVAACYQCNQKRHTLRSSE